MQPSSHDHIAKAALAAVLVLLQLAPATAIEDETWTSTINVAGKQRMLSQRMSKEFLLVVQGIDTEANKAALQRSIGEFQSALDCLVAGCPARRVIAAPNQIVAEGLQSVLTVWQPFAALLGNIAGVVGPLGHVSNAMLEELLHSNLELLRDSNIVVERIIDAAQASGAPTIGQAVNIVARQRTLVQRMCKELIAVSLGVLATENLASLQETWNTFHDSHEGLLLGAPWAGVPVLSRRCTLLMMKEVSYEWERFRPLIGQVLAEPTLEGSQTKARELAEQVSAQTDLLFAAVVEGVDSYISPVEDCEAAEPTASEWFHLLDKVGHQTLLGQDTVHLFAEVAAGLDPEGGQIALISEIRAAEFDLRYLIQGSKARGIPSPPSQEILDQLTAIYKIWQPMEATLLGAVGSVGIDPVLLHQVASYSRQHYEATRRAADLYVERARNSTSSVDAALVDLLERQRVLPAKMLKEATLVYAGETPEVNGAEVNETRALFTETHWNLLLGGNTTPGLPAQEGTREVCLVQQMKRVADLFHDLESTALATARGATPDPPAVRRVLQQMDEASAIVIRSFAALPAVPSCSSAPQNVTSAEWSSALQALGSLGALVQRASIAHLAHRLASSQTLGPGSQWSSQDLAQSRSSLRWASLRLTFGSGAQELPAPWDQATMDGMWDLLASWRAFERLLEDQLEMEARDRATGTTGSASSEAILGAGQELTAAVEAATARYLAAAGADSQASLLPLQRLHTAARQSLLSHTAVQEALLARSGDRGALQEMEIAFARFETAHHELRDGAADFPAIIPQRPDLLAQWSRVNDFWPGFVQQVRALANGADNVPHCLQDLQRLGEELAAATALFALPDPHVPAEEAGFPYSALIYTLWGLAMLAVVVAAIISSCYCVARKHKRFSDESGLPQWNDEAV